MRVGTAAVIAIALLGPGLVLLANSLVAKLFSAVVGPSSMPWVDAAYTCIALLIVICTHAAQAVLYERLSASVAIRYRDMQEKALISHSIRAAGEVRNKIGTSHTLSLLTYDLGRTMAGLSSSFSIGVNALCLLAYIIWFAVFSFSISLGLTALTLAFFCLQSPIARLTARRDADLMAVSDTVKNLTEDHLLAGDEIFACHEEEVSARMTDELMRSRRKSYFRMTHILSAQVALNLVTPPVGMILGLFLLTSFQRQSEPLAVVVPVLLWALPNMLGHMVQVTANVHSITSSLVSLHRLRTILSVGCRTARPGAGVLCGTARESEIESVTVTGFNVNRDGVNVAVFERFEAASLRPTVVMGPRGSGKSTLIRALAGLEEPSTGNISINGAGITWSYLRETGSVSYLPQHPTLFDGSIYENLHLDALDRNPDLVLLDPVIRSTGLFDMLVEIGKRQERLTETHPNIEALELAYARRGLDVNVGRYGSQLSGGERQLVAICRCLLRRRPVTLLDEPLNHLDKTLRSKVSSVLVGSFGRRVMVFSTHNIDGLELSGAEICDVARPV
ncbi:ATP-binding cassette domain-containing protein [Muricoccus pecuniae]|uniref:ABC-type transport system involved in cytochrome bd biosynthesis fused ATPase/permease subunit n=1 Tax=Muricoccus pecuniae TaxID=693023 RepID=A0A840YCQ7_9PROT|nr:ABC transporter ATP-binding protein [Roseomonas pecuniae]MBB5696469.1 ABC-type transport system involved in cytochrome bd biosynthesis fused ATPase/permease subunit [Roseomonas pecuniae]